MKSLQKKKKACRGRYHTGERHQATGWGEALRQVRATREKYKDRDQLGVARLPLLLPQTPEVLYLPG